MAGSRCGNRITGFTLALVLAVGGFGSACAALTPEQATQVGGSLGEAGRQLAALQAAALKVVE
ncbi:MAG: hypothetical protein ACMG6H_00495, partial [Acidobacteriota bacterium]